MSIRLLHLSAAIREANTRTAKGVAFFEILMFEDCQKAFAPYRCMGLIFRELFTQQGRKPDLRLYLFAWPDGRLSAGLHRERNKSGKIAAPGDCYG